MTDPSRGTDDPQGNLHVALAMLLPRANPSWSNRALLAEVGRYVAMAQVPRDGLFARRDDAA